MHMGKYKIVLNSIFVAKELIYLKKGIEKVNNIFHNFSNFLFNIFVIANCRLDLLIYSLRNCVASCSLECR